MFVVILVMFWFQMRGYMVYGVSAEAFRNCLRRTLDKLNLPYQESFSSIRLETVDANFTGVGTGLDGHGTIADQTGQICKHFWRPLPVGCGKNSSLKTHRLTRRGSSCTRC